MPGTSWFHKDCFEIVAGKTYMAADDQTDKEQARASADRWTALILELESSVE